MLCQFQVYSKVIHFYIYMYLFFFKFFSHLGYCRILSRVPCATQQVLVGYQFYFILFINKFLFILFIYFWLRWVFVAVCGLSLVVASGGYSSLRCAGFSLWWLLLLWSTGSRCADFSSCGTWAQQLWLMGSRAQAQQLWCMGLVALWHVGSSRTRAQTCVSCLGRQILNHCTTREARLSILIQQCAHVNPKLPILTLEYIASKFCMIKQEACVLKYNGCLGKKPL